MTPQYDICAVPGCRERADLTYLGYPVCNKDWMRHTSETDKFNLKTVFNIQDKKEEIVRQRLDAPVIERVRLTSTVIERVRL